MKKNTYVLLLFVLSTIFGTLYGQDIVVQVEGIVVDSNDGSPVENHLVLIESESGGVQQEFTVYTNASGNYYLDSLIMSSPGEVSATVEDCLGVFHTQTGAVSPNSTVFVFDFAICTDTNPDCVAYFIYETLSFPDSGIVFQNLSTGNYTTQFWDFGDGTTSGQQNPVHQYEFPGEYEVCLTISSNDRSCYDTWCENLIIWEDSCQNTFIAETPNQADFTFTAFSVPDPADYYSWDFGDGESGSGEVVTHSYDASISGFVDVVLTTYIVFPAGPDTCIAQSSETIVVGDSLSGCDADFTVEPDSLDQLHLTFTDVSTGPALYYFWDFGDGTTSEEQHPEHNFPGPGIYSVCLTVYSDNPGSYCMDVECKDIEVFYSMEALFESTLDTLSGEQGLIQFTDMSSGLPDSWTWDFGDGNYSYEQHPVHQYNEPGNYEVCLTSYRLLAGFNFEDTECKEIESPQYFDLGGQVYLDEVPMNNFNGDTTVVDYGQAFLYRVYENTLIPADTQLFSELGYYWFSGVRAGEYLVKVALLEGSEHFDDFVPAYHSQSIHWEDALPIALNDSSHYQKSIHIQPMAELLPGTATLSGFVNYSGIANPLMPGLQHIDVFLFNSESKPVRKTKTQANGSFWFDELPSGTYLLYSEVSGLFTEAHQLVLEEGMSGIDSIQLHLSTQVLDILEQPVHRVVVGMPFPNPIKDILNLPYTHAHSGTVQLCLYDLTGNLLFQREHILSGNEGVIRMDLQSLKNGVYLLSITCSGTEIPIIRKIVK